MKRVISILLILIISLSFMGIPNSQAESLAEKEEVIYGILRDDGKIQDIYVVNSFSQGTIIDYGNYLEVKNLSSTEKIHIDGDRVSINTSKSNFYYQGKLSDKNLPWTFNIKYHLDGKEILATDLPGKNGDIEIEITITQNDKIKDSFFENYMLQASLSLDTEKFIDIESPNGVLARAGKNQVIAHTILPGSKNAKILVRAKVVDFEMAAIEIAAMPFTMGIDIPNIQSLTSQLTETLQEAVDALSDGIGELSGGLSLLSSGALSLNDGSGQIKDALAELSNNSITLIAASSQIKAGLEAINSGLSGSFSLDDMAALPEALYEMADGLEQITDGLKQLKLGYSFAYNALDDAIMSIPTKDIDLTGIYTTASIITSIKGTVDSLVEYYIAAKTVQGTYEATKEAFSSVEPALGTVADNLTLIKNGLKQMARGIEKEIGGLGQLGQLAEGIESLATNYKQFHIGLDEYMAGVKELSKNYAIFHTGLGDLKNGLGEIDGGAKEIYSGSQQLSDGIDKMPELIQDEIEKLNKSDFVMESFVSEKNKNVKAVQFVLKTEGIKKEAKTIENPAPAKLTFWQKILKLLGLYKKK